MRNLLSGPLSFIIAVLTTMGRVVAFILMLLFALIFFGGLAVEMGKEATGAVGIVMVVITGALMVLFGWLAFRRRDARAAPVKEQARGRRRLVAKGVNGVMSFDGKAVTLSDMDSGAMIIQGPSADRTIMLTSIRAVRLKPPEGVMRGRLELTVSEEAQVVAAAAPETIVTYEPFEAQAFNRMAAAINIALTGFSAPAPAPPPIAPQPLAPEPDDSPHALTSEAIEELARLGDLRDRKVLTEDEFQEQKALILNR